MKKDVPDLRTTLLPFASNESDDSESAANETLPYIPQSILASSQLAAGLQLHSLLPAKQFTSPAISKLDVVTGDQSDRPSRYFAGQEPKIRDQFIAGLLGRAHTTWFLIPRKLLTEQPML